MHTISLRPGLAAKVRRAWQERTQRLRAACRGWRRAFAGTTLSR